ncbi:hypothetical protein ACO0SA_003048 [Hanseniaspora valbyensis]
MSLPERFQNNFLPEEIQFLVENELVKIVPAMDGKTSRSRKENITSKEKRKRKLLEIKRRQREEKQKEIYSDDEDNPYQEKKENNNRNNLDNSNLDLDLEMDELNKEEDEQENTEYGSFDWSFITTDQNVLRNLSSSIPIEIPLWMAMILKKQRFCRMVTPSWLSVKRLKEYLQFERNNSYKFSALPWSWMVISKIFINQFPEDLPSEDKLSELRSVLQDIREIRMVKVQRGMEILNESHLQLDNLSLLEINEFRPFILTTMTRMKDLHKSSLTQEDLRDKPEERENLYNNDDKVPMDIDNDIDDYSMY